MSPFAQRFAAAVQVLVGDGPVKQRLASAYAHLEDLAAGELPSHIRQDFEELQAALTHIAPAGSETRVRATVRKMSSEEAAHHAGTIAKLCAELLVNLERAEPLKVVGPVRKPPRYLSGG